MCGLVGMAGFIGQKESKLLRFLLEVDVIRGRDSTGVAFVSTGNQEVKVEKDVGPPQNLWDFGVGSKFNLSGLINWGSQVVIGHNRAATMGKVIADNAHPFTYGDITGAHNGTLYDWSDLEDYTTLDVDSKALMNTINKKGIDHTWKSFTGAAALTYWNAADQTINFVRNKERPLHYAISEDGRTMFWASESWMLSIGAAKCDIKLKVPEYDDKEKPKAISAIQQFQTHRHYSVKMTSNCVIKMEDRELEKKSYQTWSTGNSYGRTTMGQAGTKTHYGKKKDKSKLINQGWASGLKKADKVWRSQEVKLVGTSAKNTGFTAHRYVVMEYEDGTRLEVFPKTEEEFNKYYDLTMGSATTYYKVKFRPRVKLTSMGIISSLAVASEGIVMSKKIIPQKKTPTNVVNRSNVEVLYAGPGGLVTKAGWESVTSQLKPSHSCTSCLNPFTIEEADELHWLGPQEVYCKDCSSNTNLMYELYYDKKG